MPDVEISCLMLHPVGWPNHGPHVELYLAEEAVGLVRSLDWTVVRGPTWTTLLDDEVEEDAESSADEAERLQEGAQGSEGSTIKEEFEDGPRPRRPSEFSRQANIARLRRENIRDGDYVYGPGIRGVFYRGGVILDFDEDPSKKEQDEWRNANLRESVARSCLVRCRKVSSTNYFTKGKLNELGLHIKENPDINVVFVNTSLTGIQIKKLEKRWNEIIMDREERVRQYYLRSAQKEHEFSPTESDTSTAMSDFGGDALDRRKIRVVDRFGMIL